MFQRADLTEAASDLGVPLPKNLGDVVYSFRYRVELPKSIARKAPAGHSWIIRSAGPGNYKFVAVKVAHILPSQALAETKVLDSTPGVIEKYAFTDEQALLAKLRYNRLIDIFTGLTCYSLQNHLRTTVPGMGQVETDEIYIGIDRRGAHFALPVQAKGRSEMLGVVQIEQDLALCEAKFPELICRAVAAQFMEANLIALFELENGPKGIAVVSEKHYRLVPVDGLSSEELQAYRARPPES